MALQLITQNRYGKNNPIHVEYEIKRKDPTKAMQKLANELRRDMPDHNVTYRTV